MIISLILKKTIVRKGMRVFFLSLIFSSLLSGLSLFPIFAEPTSQQPEPKKLLIPPSLSDSLEEFEKKLTEATSLLRALRNEVEDRERLLKAKMISELERIPFPSSGITFQPEKAKLSEESKKVLDRAVELLQVNPTWLLRIEGHTDSMGDEKFNLTLSRERAESVRDYLIERGIDPGRLQAIGFGEQFPLAPNTTAEGRAANRRIVFKVITEKAAP
ncbi:MAG: OmpA family protein [Candidatus Tectomicrobia bacterium]|nr:OmpA family protein [Candidatus Tectomicrobia bacterium]